MRTKSRLLAIGSIALFAALLLAPSVSLAHERRTVSGGKYDVVVGWNTEPALSGEMNEPSIRISQAGSNPAVPVTGAEKTLKLQVRQGGVTKEFPLRAVFGQQGYYVTDLMPTRAGDYQFIFSGTINDDPVTETFDSADGKFDAVKSAADTQFPVALPDPAQQSAQVQSAVAASQTDRMLGIAGIVLGTLGLLAGLGTWLTRPRQPAGVGAAAAPISRAPASDPWLDPTTPAERA